MSARTTADARTGAGARRCVAVIGGAREDRAKAVAELLGEIGPEGSALLLTSSASHFRRALGASAETIVEFRDDDQEAHARAFAARLRSDFSRGPGLLLLDRNSSVAEAIGWEYLRRAAESGAWDLVVRELDGTTSALGRLEAPRRGAELVESLWPRNTRYAALAAGEHIDPVVLDAHEIAHTLDVLRGWLTGDAVESGVPAHDAGAEAGVDRRDGGEGTSLPPLTIVVAGEGEDAAAAAATAALLGARTAGAAPLGPPERIPAIDGLPSYRLEVSVPAEPDGTPAVIDGSLVLDFSGIRVSIDVGSVLARCLVHDSHFDPGDGVDTLTLTFVADRAMWPESMLARA